MKTKIMFTARLFFISALLLILALFLCRNVSAKESNLIMYEPKETISETQTTEAESGQPTPSTGEKRNIFIPCAAAVFAAGAGITAGILGKNKKRN